jgi:hypothetical protein
MTAKPTSAQRKFIKVWQGLHDHLPDFPPSALKLYLNLLFHVYSRDATEGRVQITNSRLQEETGLSTDTIAKALKWLAAPLNGEGPLDPYVIVSGKGHEQIITINKYENPFIPPTTPRRSRAKRPDAIEPANDHESTNEREWDDSVPF